MAKFSSIQSFWQEDFLIKVFGLSIIGSLLAGILTEMYFLAGIPAFLLLVFISIVDFKKVFFLLFFCIPLSTEIELPGGFATDLPSEPLMVGLMLLYLLFVLRSVKNIKTDFLLHPVSLLLLLHFGWICATSIWSENFVISLKFSLAKFWYIVVFFFLAGTMLKKEKDFKILIWGVLIPLVLTVFSALIKHAGYDFAFDRINRSLEPFYRNHVSYAAILTLFIPFVWYLKKSYRRFSITWFVLIGCLLILLVGTWFSYTRAAYVGLLIAMITSFIIKFRLIKYAIGIAVIGVTAVIISLSVNNTYLDYAPEYEKTVAHKDFDSLISATAKGEDASTMERFYRWIAGAYMIKEKPVLGFGPGNFYNYYHSYTVRNFETYVSKNPEKSGIHSYYLMTAVEQGLMGLFFFLVLNFYFLIKGEVVYHQTEDLFRKRILMAALLAVIAIDCLLIINDLIETDKVGSFFFVCLAILINTDLYNKRKLKEALSQ